MAERRDDDRPGLAEKCPGRFTALGQKGGSGDFGMTSSDRGNREVVDTSTQASSAQASARQDSFAFASASDRPTPSSGFPAAARAEAETPTKVA